MNNLSDWFRKNWKRKKLTKKVKYIKDMKAMCTYNNIMDYNDQDQNLGTGWCDITICVNIQK
jgi:hypothetical protein